MKKISSKIIIITVFIAFITGIIISGTMTYQNIQIEKKLLNIEKQTLNNYYDIQIKQQVESAISMIDAINSKTITGELTIDEAKKQSADLLRKLRFGKNGYFWADTVGGVNVVLLGSKVEGTNRLNLQDDKGKYIIKEIIDNGKKENGGYTDYWFPKAGETKSSLKRGYSKLYEPFNWVIGTGNYIDEIEEINEIIASNEAMLNLEFRNSMIFSMIFFIIAIIIAVILSVFLSKDITKPLIKIKNLAQRLSVYDFSTPITVTRKDEFAQTALALNKAQENINILVKEIMGNSEEIGASSQELSAIAEELFSKAISINKAINNIADGMQDSSATSEEISASVQEMDSSITKLAEKAMEGSSNANKSKERATEVQKNSKKAINETKNLYAEKKNNMLKVIEEAKVVDNIEVMADTIGSIAEQTNLLALNAAIEAARAGEQGKGFAIVAEEVRKLAEQSSQAVTSIKDTITRVQEVFKSSIDTGSDILEFINKQVNEQLDAYGQTGNQYYNDSDFVSGMSEEFAAMSEEITATVGQVNEAIQNMAETAQKSSEETETIKEGADETTKAIEHVALTAQSQAELAQKLNEMVQKFKI